MVDINEAPLQFAYKVGLCDRFFPCDLKHKWPEELSLVMKNKVNLLICVGVTTYIGIDGFNSLVKFVEKESEIEYFCFSLCSFICDSYLQVFNKSGLFLQKLGDVRQRDYQDDEERLKIRESLKLQNRYSLQDEDGLMASLYLAYKK